MTRRYETWLEVELAAADAMADAGLVPRDAAAEMRARAGFDIGRIEEIEAVTQHDVIAFTTAVAEKVGPAASNRITQSRRVCRSMPPIFAAASRAAL